MKKSLQIVMSLALILAAIIIYLLSSVRSEVMDMDWVGFFAGFVFALGIGSIGSMFFRKKETV